MNRSMKNGWMESEWWCDDGRKKWDDGLVLKRREIGLTMFDEGNLKIKNLFIILNQY